MDNRLTNLDVTNGGATPVPIATYAYTVDNAGHRTGVTELSGRAVNYGYDNLYRLTNETIASDPNAMNGVVSYVYDAVGNRTQKVSTLPGYPGGLTNYNANDQIGTDTYDAEGNTTASNGTGYVYDFENHLIQANGITYVYDGDGNRVSKTVAGVTTTYLVDDQNPTGYAQVLQEQVQQSGVYPVEYVYGLEQFTRFRRFYDAGGNFNRETIFYEHDGHGSVRSLTDGNGTVLNTYDYDAFGNLLHSTGTLPNNYLFAGEQFDPDLGMYFNRARYLNTSSGRFWTMDTHEGDDESPISLHKYLYANADPANITDPSGHGGAAEAIETAGISLSIDAQTALQIFKVGAKVLALACSVGIGLAAVAGGGACGVNFNEMRVQLQEGNINTFGIPIRAPEVIGVTTLQVRTALLSIYLGIFVEGQAETAFFPKNASGSFIGLLSSIIYLSQRVGEIQAGGGVTLGGRILFDEFIAGKRMFRIDIDNLRGHNLRL